VRIGVNPVRVDRSEDGVVTTTPDDGTTLVTDEILISTGRRANTIDLGLDTIGITPGEWLTVDDTMLVAGTDWLYAVGDVNGRALLTHQGKYQARAAGEVIAARITGTPVHDEPWGDHVATADHGAVPHVIFTDPEVAGVGLTEAQARAQGLNIRVVEYELGWVAGAKLHADGYEGHAKLVIDEDHHIIAGATFVGQDVAELLHAAIVGKCQSAGSGTPSPPTPPSARSGSDSSKPTAAPPKPPSRTINHPQNYEGTKTIPTKITIVIVIDNSAAPSPRRFGRKRTAPQPRRTAPWTCTSTATTTPQQPSQLPPQESSSSDSSAPALLSPGSSPTLRSHNASDAPPSGTTQGVVRVCQ